MVAQSGLFATGILRPSPERIHEHKQAFDPYCFHDVHQRHRKRHLAKTGTSNFKLHGRQLRSVTFIMKYCSSVRIRKHNLTDMSQIRHFFGPKPRPSIRLITCALAGNCKPSLISWLLYTLRDTRRAASHCLFPE